MKRETYFENDYYAQTTVFFPTTSNKTSLAALDLAAYTLIFSKLRSALFVYDLSQLMMVEKQLFI
jgi:hypothetical protein